ncbi:DUF397 domain-containing protein [Streptomyces scabiei]|uniref:DUF397 domain-containing protein n=1 Tax=Streptomyces scabiei TaxID=1930 RepID=UPI00298F6326|nr:DUF397 domain-containing protein [Streptomyces scabiei]MDW8807479.1 DUF397 domain-containing protein [Streptomyces scabiei]
MARALNWQKSTFSGGAEGNACVELAAALEGIRLRESDTPATDLRHIKAGGFRTTS